MSTTSTLALFARLIFSLGIVIGLMWWKRKELLALPLQIWWPGILFLIAGSGLHLLELLLHGR